MVISFDNSLGIHQYSVNLRERHAEILATNLAHANTPGFKAKGMDFRNTLLMLTSNLSANFFCTHENHLDANKTTMSVQQLYRIPTQPDTGDGNTVNVSFERNLFMENQIRHRVSVDFLGSKFRNLTKAIKGE
ncbi:flagellar basal-body rod protein flgB [Candidatus Photodesmus katoptron]|uniref:Flagellar basal body rod protein FlgB n=1 Tax=Candidatus Photodesmus katoptron Akat1 TaxID=1236703 RepID=S3EIF6_9GAMM|nr:flagellar basal body rod protein FlgB [Candidatus Photodesmus katoptron]EPE37968.1 flagellar basal-body rod protein FlgB [Candidatus Photodesmus katoptron Akat1]KEY90246.1 flagellar basal-body rod protein flgB [Candidatus Photodesmus katoptron]